MPRRFKNVEQFSKTENGNKLISMIEDYAKETVNETFGVKMSVDTKYSKEEKAKRINDVYISEIAKHSGLSLADCFNNVEDYAKMPMVASYAGLLNKILLDSALPIYISATGLNMLAEFHYGGYGDIFSFEMKDNSPYNVSKMGARQKHTKVQDKKKQNVNIATDFYGLTTMATLPQIMLGEANIADDIMLMTLSMNKKIYKLVVKKFTEKANAITDTDLIVTNYTDTAFLEKLRTGSAKNGSPMVIVGDAVALKSLVPSNTNTRILITDEFNTTLGYMSVFNGYKVIGFDVVEDEDETGGVLGLPTNKVYGIPQDGSKLIHVAIGETRTNTDGSFENNNLSILSTLRKEIGVELATNKKVVRVDIDD